jgi:N-acetylmuramoyl-L-alanine amidase
MALTKTNLNSVLKSEERRNSLRTSRYQEKTAESVDETFVKRNTTLGQQDGEILGGVKSLGQTCNSSEEVITGHVGKITDDFPASGAKGNVLVVTKDTVVDSNGEFLRFKEDADSAGSLVLNTLSITTTTDSDGNGNNFDVVGALVRSAGRDSADEARGFGTLSTSVAALTGLPAIKSSNPTSALAVTCDGTAESISKCIAIAQDKQNDAYQSLIDFTTTVDALKPKSAGGGGIMGIISTVTSALTFASNLTASFSSLAPVAELNGKINAIQSKIDAGVAKVNAKIDAVTGEIESGIKDALQIDKIDGFIQTTKDTVLNDTGIQGYKEEFQSLKNELDTLKDMKSVVETDVANVKGAIDEATGAVDQFNSQFDGRTDKGLSGVVQNMAEGLSGTASTFISTLVDGGISTTEGERKKILEQFASEDVIQKKEAIKTLTDKSENVSDRMKGILATDEGTTSTLEMQVQMIEKAKEQGVPEQEIARAQQEISTIDQKMRGLDTTIGGTVIIDASLYEEGQPVMTDKWDGRNSPDDAFTYVSSVEELDAEFTNVNRDVTEVVVHATETHTNKDIGSIEINNVQIDMGHDGIGYHYVIRRDGRLQRGRPVNIQGDHAPVNGHDKYSIGIALVGGINVSTGEDNPEDYRSSQSFTREQFTTLEKFLGGYYRRFPGGQVFGHNDLDINEFDPYFDVVDYVESVFRKQNRTDDPLNASPLSPSEMNK